MKCSAFKWTILQFGFSSLSLNFLPAPPAGSGRVLRVWVDFLHDVHWRGLHCEARGQVPPQYLGSPSIGLPLQSLPLPQRGGPAGARHQGDHQRGHQGEEGVFTPEQGVLAWDVADYEEYEE